MRRRLHGYSALRGFRGLQDDILALIGEHAPEWLTPGFTIIHVEQSGRAGLAEFREKISGVDPSATVVLTAPAQGALLTYMEEEADILDAMFEASLDIPDPEGADLRDRIMAKRANLDNRFAQLERANQEAMRRSIPGIDALESPEAARTMTGFEIAAIALLAAAVVVTAVICWKGIDAWQEADVQMGIFEGLAEAGQWDKIGMIYGDIAKDEGFPWGWVIGIGTVLLGGGLLFAWYSGYLGELGERMAGGD